MVDRGMTHGPPLPADADRLSLLGGGRVWGQNIQPLLEMLALYAGGGFSSTEWSLMRQRLSGTDDSVGDGWYTHPLSGGVAQLVVVMARAHTEDAVSVRVWGNDVPGLNERVDTLFDICTLYRLEGP